MVAHINCAPGQISCENRTARQDNKVGGTHLTATALLRRGKNLVIFLRNCHSQCEQLWCAVRLLLVPPTGATAEGAAVDTQPGFGRLISNARDEVCETSSLVVNLGSKMDTAQCNFPVENRVMPG